MNVKNYFIFEEMDTTDNIATQKRHDDTMSAMPDSSVADAGKGTGRHNVFYRICAVVGLLCAVSGWLLFYFEPEAALAVSGAGVIASVCGILSGRGCLRSLAITGLVASVVLVLVYTAFFWGLAWGVSHL